MMYCNQKVRFHKTNGNGLHQTFTYQWLLPRPPTPNALSALISSVLKRGTLSDDSLFVNLNGMYSNLRCKLVRGGASFIRKNLPVLRMLSLPSGTIASPTALLDCIKHLSVSGLEVVFYRMPGVFRSGNI